MRAEFQKPPCTLNVALAIAPASGWPMVPTAAKRGPAQFTAPPSTVHQSTLKRAAWAERARAERRRHGQILYA